MAKPTTQSTTKQTSRSTSKKSIAKASEKATSTEIPAKPTTKAKTATEPALIGPNHVVTLKIDAKTASSAYQKILNKLAKRVKLPGFRQGKVPTHLAEQELDQTAIFNEALEIVIPPLYKSEIVDKKLESLAQPEFKPTKLVKNSDWEVEVHLAPRPQITIKNLKQIVKKGKENAKEEIKKQQDHLKKTKHNHDHDSHENQPHSHNHQHPSEEDITLTNIYQQLVSQIRPTLPELLVKEEVRAELENLVRRLQSISLTIDDYLKQQNISYDELTNQMAVASVGRLQLMLILDEIANQEKMEVLETEIDDEIKKNTSQEKTKAPQANNKELEKNPEYRNFVRQTLQRDKLTKYLLSL